MTLIHEPNKPKILIWDDFREKTFFDRRKPSDIRIQTVFGELIDKVYFIVQHKSLRDKSIDIFRNCFGDSSKVIWEEAGAWILKFCYYFPEFSLPVDELIISKKASIRLRLIQSIWVGIIPRNEQIKNLLLKGLVDKNNNIRYFTVERIRFTNSTDLLKEMKMQEEKEANNEIKILIRQAIDLIEKGFYIKTLPSRRVSVTIPKENGSIFSTISFYMDKKDATEENIKKLHAK